MKYSTYCYIMAIGTYLRGGGSTITLVRQNIVEALYVYAGQENELEWWNGL